MTQTNQVIEQLKTGSVSRNWALERRITRLGAIVCSLRKQEKYRKIEGGFEPTDYGQDYIYRLPNADLKLRVLNADNYLKTLKADWKNGDALKEFYSLSKKANEELKKVNPKDYVLNMYLDSLRTFRDTLGAK